MNLSSLPFVQAARQLFALLVCEALLGWERQSQHNSAGLRTNIMIVLGAAAIWLLGAIALACGAGQYVAVFTTVGFSMLVLAGFGFLGKTLTEI